MEFDPDNFMDDVHAALQHRSPHSRGGALRSREQHDGDNRDLDSILEEGSEPMFPASKRRRLSTNTDSTSPESFDIGEWLTAGNEALNIDAHAGSDSESDDDVPAFFSPSLDMTTALVSSHPRIPPAIPANSWELEERGSSETSLMSTERLDLVPNFYTYSVKSCLLPIRRVQHALVSLYFHHIHPMFPVVDEYRMTELHQKYRGQEELMDPSDFTVYHAIMVAGFAHLSEAQVCNTPYRSVLEGQEAQVEQLKARYWSQPTADPVVLTQICLILSLWSPGWIGAQNNSYWLDMAFKHATMGRLWEGKPGDMIKGRKCRKHLLWWCCLIRDRVLALGMRRPHRLHKTPIQDEIISEEDFGLEATYPSYTDVKSKRVAMLAFIWFCRLSRIMEAIAVVQRRNRFARDWNGDNVGNVTSELEEVNHFDMQLKEWLEEFEFTAREEFMIDKDQPVPVPISTLRIIAQ
ncbi:hypothetical protein N431DRAFT_341151 [Stipitochalara longipes BDJ]|nr:hypothetical protein N431DRAFT_341151 [Stipitochalara longipes BDJ]